MLAKNKILILLVILLVCAISWIVYQNQSTPKTGFILIQDLYSGFNMKKEIEKKYQQTKNARDKILDSLTLELKILAKKVQSEQEKNKLTLEGFNAKRDEYMQRKQTYEEDNNALAKQYDKEILTQLNQYVKDFGEKNHYTYVFGNDGNGSLLYGAEAKNITKQVLEYINDRYKGID